MEVVISTFAAGTEGWTSSDGDNALSIEGGYLLVKDISGGWHWLSAPRKSHGDWRNCGELFADIRGDIHAGIIYAVGFEVSDGSNVATYDFPVNAVVAGEWQTLSVALEPTYWSVQGNWEQMIGQVTSFRIRIDLSDNVSGEEVEEVDNVRLGPQ